MATPLDWYNLRQLRSKGFTSQFASTSVGRMHWLSAAGGGEHTIVLIHGLGGRGAHFRRLCLALLPNVRRLILPDLIGHGNSEMPEGDLSVDVIQTGLEELLEEHLDEPAVVYGNSMGGRAALLYGARRPDRVKGLMVTSPAGGWAQRMPLEEVKDSFRVKTHADALAFTDRVFAKPVPMKHVVAWVVARQLRAPAARTLVEGTGHHDVLPPEALQTLKPPTLFVWGEAERVLPAEHLEYFQAHLPSHVRIERPRHYGHSAYAEHPDDLAERLLSFTQTLS